MSGSVVLYYIHYTIGSFLGLQCTVLYDFRVYSNACRSILFVQQVR